MAGPLLRTPLMMGTDRRTTTFLHRAAPCARRRPPFEARSCRCSQGTPLAPLTSYPTGSTADVSGPGRETYVVHAEVTRPWRDT